MASSTILLVAAPLLFTGCTGSRANVRFDDLRYPVSMSKLLYDRNGNIVTIGKGLKIIDTFEFKEKHWSILYTIGSPPTSSSMDRRINEAIEKANGVGAINIKIENEQCVQNAFPFLPWIPLYPGCQNFYVSGDIVAQQ